MTGWEIKVLKDLVISNRSYRRFRENERISEAQLVDLIELTRFVPSAANLQNLRFRLIHTEEECRLLFPNLKWAGYLRYWDGPEPGERPTAYIIIMAPDNTTRFHHTDSGITAQTIMLGAVEQGLRGCMLASVDKDAIHQAFHLPDELEILLVLALGYPAEKVVIEEVIDPDDIEYWRDEEGVHHVPKRKLSDLIIKP
jgi:nitroreductase